MKIPLWQLLCLISIRQSTTDVDTPMKQILSMAAQATPLLQAARKSAGLSQTELARRLGLSQSRMSAMELDPSSVRLDQLLAMCAALHLELQVQTQAEHGKSSNAANVQEW
jgi:HTH-type transcriptional regulator / antitoxin HipB